MSAHRLPEASAWADLWDLDPGLVFLNHGSFGACPRGVTAEQARLRAELEHQPVAFLGRGLEARLDVAREALAAFLGADAEGLAFVANATTGVNTVLHSLELAPGDELLTTDHAYPACRNALVVKAEAARARVVTAEVPFPVTGPDAVEEALLAALTSRTRLVLLDHVASPTGLVFPLERLVPRLAELGVLVLVDGAHAPGMLPLEVARLGAHFYTGNCHKWLCAPKGVGFLWVAPEHRGRVRPLVISHGAASPRRDRTRFRLEFDWTGTQDPTPALCVPAAIAQLGSLLPGGWPELMEHNRRLALAARAVVCEGLGIPPPSPPEMVGSLASVPLPDATAPLKPPLFLDEIQRTLLERHRIEIPVFPWPAEPQRLLRLSAQLYNSIGQYEYLTATLASELAGC